MITLESAIKSLKSQVPEAKPLAYWQKEHEFVFVCDLGEVGIVSNYFRVTNDGQILGTNPILSDLDEAEMIAIDQNSK